MMTFIKIITKVIMTIVVTIAITIIKTISDEFDGYKFIFFISNILGVVLIAYIWLKKPSIWKDDKHI